MHWCNREEIKLQCDWEYHFSDSEPPHQTQLDKLTANELTGLPTSNLDAECNFSKFSWLSEVARFCNNKFSAEGIWNDMTLFKSKKELQNMIRKSFKHKRKTGMRNKMNCLQSLSKKKCRKVWDRKNMSESSLKPKKAGEDRVWHLMS